MRYVIEHEGGARGLYDVALGHYIPYTPAGGGLTYTCHMGSHKMKVTDCALYTVTWRFGVIFLISLLVGSPRQIMVTHPCDKTLNTWQHTQIWGLPSAVLISKQLWVYTPYCACCHVLTITCDPYVVQVAAQAHFCYLRLCTLGHKQQYFLNISCSTPKTSQWSFM